jgi:hypothetical protein
VKYKFCIALLVLFPGLLFGEYNLPISLFVSADAGLRVRESPSVNSRVIKVIQYGEFIDCMERTDTKDTVDGIDDFWYKTFYHGGWVFGGYLTERLESEPLLGRWRVENNPPYGWLFSKDGHFTNPPLGPSGGGVIEGTFEKNDSGVLLHFDYSANYEPERHIYTQQATVDFVNIDRISLRLDNEEYILVRENELGSVW